MNYLFLLGFTFPAFLIFLMVSAAKTYSCSKCRNGDMTMRFNGEYMCDECGHWDESE